MNPSSSKCSKPEISRLGDVPVPMVRKGKDVTLEREYMVFRWLPQCSGQDSFTASLHLSLSQSITSSFSTDMCTSEARCDRSSFSLLAFLSSDLLYEKIRCLGILLTHLKQCLLRPERQYVTPAAYVALDCHHIYYLTLAAELQQYFYHISENILILVQISIMQTVL